MKYTDPTGEFFHIIIGAAIGGAVNLISGLVSHKVDNVGKGFAYFGIGALAGAASAAVGGGLSSAMAGTGFSAGFTGSATAASATSSFASGAAIGGTCGAISGSVTGLGNTLVDGGGIDRAVGQMHLQGLIDGATGAVVGGVAGGINAVRDGRDFWNGHKWETIADYQLPNGGLPLHRQKDDHVGCTQETLKSIAEYKQYYLEEMDMKEGIDFKILADTKHIKTSKSFYPDQMSKVDLIGRNLSKGNPAAITYNHHTVGINSIKIQKVNKLLGTGYRFRYTIYTMDPLCRNYRKLSYGLFKNGIVRIVF